MIDWRPKILAFVCNWCSYASADNAGSQRLEYGADIKLLRVMCSGRVDPQFVLTAFRGGADGVMILGCHPGACHYRSGNLTAQRRFALLDRLLPQLGVDRQRLCLEWVAAGEPERFQRVANDMVKTITDLGKLKLKGHVDEDVA